MHVADTDDFIDIHPIVPAYFSQLIRKCNIDGTVSILYYFRHLSCADISYNNLSFAKRCIIRPDPFSNSRIICTDCAVIMNQLIQHVSRYDPLWCVNQMHISSSMESHFFDYRPDQLISRSRRNCRFDNHDRSGGCFF